MKSQNDTKSNFVCSHCQKLLYKQPLDINKRFDLLDPTKRLSAHILQIEKSSKIDGEKMILFTYRNVSIGNIITLSLSLASYTTSWIHGFGLFVGYEFDYFCGIINYI